MSNETIVDLTGYKSNVSDRVEPGRYRFVVEDVEVGQTKAKDAVKITVWLRVQGGEFDGATIIENLTQKKAAMFRTVNFLEALGVPTPRKKFKLDFTKLVGRQLEAEVDDGEPYNNRVKSEIQQFYKISKRPASDAATASAGDLEDLGEFDPETTHNPSPDVAAARETDDTEPDDLDTEPDEEPEEEPAPRPAKKAAAKRTQRRPEPETEVDGPEEVDLEEALGDIDEIEL